ncbi:MAG TPA: PQQ-dependent sugar dehydrogenase [Alphaproteobacteria bacterium]|nr:PQQ-dependent sugar dehydrogenase [Alphaproteobacteria bacterium]
MKGVSRYFGIGAVVIALVSSSPVKAQTSWGYAPTNAFPSLVFSNPVCITAPPGETNRLFIVEKHGRVIVITNLASPTRTIFMDISSRVSVVNTSESGDVNNEEGMLSMTFDPGYVSNRYFYVFYMGQATNGTSGLHDILSRFQTSAGNPNQGDTNSETRLIAQYDRASNHNGGDTHFGPDGYLYVSVGDEGDEYNVLTNAQHIDLNFFSGMLRLDVNKLPGSLPPNPNAESAVTTNYAIPPDNPFVGATTFDGLPVNTNVLRTEFWAVGLRNPWRFSFDPATGVLYCGDVGQDQYEEVDIIIRGGNYGWATWEGTNSPPSGVSTNGQPVPLNPIFPIVTYAHGSATNQGNAVMGGVVYHGNRFTQLRGAYVYGDYVDGNVWRLTYNGNSATPPQWLFADPGISAFGTDPANGDVLYCNLKSGNNSVIKRIISTNAVPYIGAVMLSGTNLIISGANGPANGNYYVLAGTNLVISPSNWTHLSTNPFDANGNFIFTNPLTPNIPALFYLLQLQ